MTERRIEWSRLLDKSLDEAKVPIVPGKYRQPGSGNIRFRARSRLVGLNQSVLTAFQLSTACMSRSLGRFCGGLEFRAGYRVRWLGQEPSAGSAGVCRLGFRV